MNISTLILNLGLINIVHYKKKKGTVVTIPVDSIRFYCSILKKIYTMLWLYFPQLILKDYIDAAFEGMMDALSLPVPVRYFNAYHDILLVRIPFKAHCT
jgi:hypothetical protein